MYPSVFPGNAQRYDIEPSLLDQQSKDGAPTRCSGAPTLILRTQWVVVFLNILSVCHLKPSLRYVGDTSGFKTDRKPVYMAGSSMRAQLDNIIES